MSDIYYLAGPMSGIPQFNFPAFEAATKALREAGATVISPHENDPPDVQAAAWASPDGRFTDGMLSGESWGDMLARDVKLVADHATAVIVLPGWSRSRGARLEAFVALLCDKPVYQYTEGQWPLMLLHRQAVLHAIYTHTVLTP